MRTPSRRNIAAQWFKASADAGDFMGIRYGRLPGGSREIEWHFVSHAECDGIGGFARLLRERGAVIPELPVMKHPPRGIRGSLLRLWQASRKEKAGADRTDWQQATVKATGVSQAVAWHLFTEQETGAILADCKRNGYSVNSHLLKQLDHAIRPGLRRPERKIPWMIPVNLRGYVTYPEDTENHVSCIFVQAGAVDTPREINEDIQRRLDRGEHLANYFYLGLGRFLGHAMKTRILTMDRSTTPGNIGSFSNLGVWDQEKELATDDCWVFCPPVVTGQLLGAGCVTFRKRLGLAIQAHSGITASPEIASRWMQRWVDGI